MADGEQTTTAIDHSTRAAELVSIFRVLGGSQNAHMDDAWARLFNVSKSSGEFYDILGNIAGSLESLKSEISDSHLRDASKNTYVKAANILTQYVATNRLRELTTNQLHGESDSFKLLELLDDVLPPSGNRSITDKTLAEWLATVQEMIDSAKSAILDPVLRGFVIRQLAQLQWAINNYEFLGIEGISRAYGAMAAELARSTSMKGAQTAEARGWYQRAKKYVVALGVGIAATSVVVEKADNLLTHGGHMYEAITDQTSGKPKEEKSTGTAIVSSSNTIMT